MKEETLKLYLDDLVEKYNKPDFIVLDPISVPHRFSKKQDIEISAFFASILAWGQRTTIINNVNRLMNWMDESPHDFIVNHKETDRQVFAKFVHRTFQYPDLLYFLEFLQLHYQENESLENAFSKGGLKGDVDVGNMLKHFHTYFFSLPHLHRTRKHLQTPENKSACKRLNLFLKWMVRKDHKGVDFGIWDKIKTSQLICPLDVHVLRQANNLGLINTKKQNWNTALELTNVLKIFDSNDPVKYDFALFGMGFEN